MIKTPQTIETLLCPYCNRIAEFISNDLIYGKIYGNGMAYYCQPCNAYVGCHDSGRAKGALANKELRRARALASQHLNAFLLNQTDKKKLRLSLRKLLAKYLGISQDIAHVGTLNLELCRRTLDFDPDRFN